MMKFTMSIIFLCLVFIISLLYKNEYADYTNTFLVLLFYLIVFLQEFSFISKNFDANFKIRSIRKKPKWKSFLFSMLWSIFIYYSTIEVYSKFLMIIFIWMIVIVDIILFFTYKKKKPFTLFINKNDLIFNDVVSSKRDITGLNRILFDRYSKVLELKFDRGFKLKINTKNYEKKDINELLSILIDKSNHKIFIPKNYLEEQDKP